jgi:hypothetical protein
MQCSSIARIDFQQSPSYPTTRTREVVLEWITLVQECLIKEYDPYFKYAVLALCFAGTQKSKMCLGGWEKFHLSQKAVSGRLEAEQFILFTFLFQLRKRKLLQNE